MMKLIQKFMDEFGETRNTQFVPTRSMPSHIRCLTLDASIYKCDENARRKQIRAATPQYNLLCMDYWFENLIRCPSSFFACAIIYLSICLSSSPSVCLPINLCLYTRVPRFLRMPVYPICWCVSLPDYSVRQSVCPSLSVSISLGLYLSRVYSCGSTLRFSRLSSPSIHTNLTVLWSYWRHLIKKHNPSTIDRQTHQINS